jgi:hypothetical protein
MSNHEEPAARLLERLLTDRVLRARFRADPAGVLREAGVDEAFADEVSGSAMETLEVRESRSSLAGALTAAALEGFAGLGLSDAYASGGRRDLTPTVDRWLERRPPAAAVPPAPSAGSGPAAGLATPEAAAAERASSGREGGGAWTARSAGNAAELAEPRPVAPASGAPVAPEPNGRSAGGAGQVVDMPRPKARAAFTPPDPSDYGMGGTGGKPTAEALALLENPKVKFLDAAGPKDIRSGRIDPRAIEILTRLAKDHRITLSALASNHEKFSAGGGISNHWYGRGVDVAGVDGQAVNGGNAAARAIAESLIKLPESIRPTEVGSPWQIGAPGFFSDAAHQNHIHIAFDDAVTKDWRPPPGSAAPEPTSNDAGVFAAVGPKGATPRSAPEPAPAPASAAAMDPPVPSDPTDGADSTPDPPEGPDDGGADASGREDPSGDSNAEADQESDQDSVGDDEGEGDSSGGSDGEDVDDESDESDEQSDADTGEAAGDQPAPAPTAPSPDSAPIVLDDVPDPAQDLPGPVGEQPSSSSDQGGGASDVPAIDDAGGGGGGGYPGDDAPRAQTAAWMSNEARRRGLPPELPVMASLVESGMKNLNGGDRDSVGFFQMRVGIWNNGQYAGYPRKPELQLRWFLDKALEVKKQRLAQGQSVTDPNQYGEWIADVERPAEQYRGRYQLRLSEARALLAAGAVAQDPGQGGGGHLADVVDSGSGSGSGTGGGGSRAVKLALGAVGTRETGNNAGGAVKYQRAWGAGPGLPWCGYFVGTIARDAGAQGLTPRVGYVPNIVSDAKARSNGFAGWTTDPRSARPGDFVVLFGSSHVEMVESVNKDGSVNAIGGNTSLEGGGEGVAQKRRPPGDIVGFARPKYGGGEAA